MRYLVLATVCVLALSLAHCGGGSGGDPGGGTPHPLEGTWFGMLVESREFSFRIDRDGVVSDVTYSNPTPLVGLLGGTVHGGPPVYTLRMDTTILGVQDFAFLLDPGGRHATFASMGLSPTVAIAMFGALERGATSRPIFGPGDVWGGWSGYGYAYDTPSLGFATLAPVTATASDASPSDIFELTLPSASFQGVLDAAASSFGAWAGNVPATSARVGVVMTSDKQFVGVIGYPNPLVDVADFSYYALNRD